MLSRFNQKSCFLYNYAKRSLSIKSAKIYSDMDEVDAASYFAGNKVVVFAIPGAFTPTCQSKHVPSYIENIKKMKDMGIDKVACLSVNDRFVMTAFKKELNAEGIDFISDVDGEFTKSLGDDKLIDLSVAGLGMRATRFAFFADNGDIKLTNIEPNPGEMTNTDANTMMTDIAKLL